MAVGQAQERLADDGGRLQRVRRALTAHHRRRKGPELWIDRAKTVVDRPHLRMRRHSGLAIEALSRLNRHGHTREQGTMIEPDFGCGRHHACRRKPKREPDAIKPNMAPLRARASALAQIRWIYSTLSRNKAGNGHSVPARRTVFSDLARGGARRIMEDRGGSWRSRRVSLGHSSLFGRAPSGRAGSFSSTLSTRPYSRISVAVSHLLRSQSSAILSFD